MPAPAPPPRARAAPTGATRDRKSTRLNSSHVEISYAVFCLKKKTSRASSPPPCAAWPRPRPPERPCSLGPPETHSGFLLPAPPERTAPAACFFFFKDPATTDIYTLSLHDALPI